MDSISNGLIEIESDRNDRTSRLTFSNILRISCYKKNFSFFYFHSILIIKVKIYLRSLQACQSGIIYCHINISCFLLRLRNFWFLVLIKSSSSSFSLAFIIWQNNNILFLCVCPYVMYRIYIICWCNTCQLFILNINWAHF